MDLPQLETFLAVAEERGFSRAAVRLHRTQSAVSQTIRRLEEDLGERLFERGSRDGTLTAAGEVLHEYATRMVRLEEEARSAVEELRSLARGRLSIAANEYTSHLLVPVLATYRQTSPHIAIVVRRSLASRIAEQVMERQVELGILTFMPDKDGLAAIAVYEDDVALVVAPAHPLAGGGAVGVRELGALNFIGHAVASPLRREVMEVFARSRTPLHMSVELPSLEAIKRFVSTGAGVAILPGLAVAQEVARGELVRVPVLELTIRRKLWIVHRRAATLSHAAAALLRMLEKLAGDGGLPWMYLPSPNGLVR